MVPFVGGVSYLSYRIVQARKNAEQKSEDVNDTMTSISNMDLSTSSNQSACEANQNSNFRSLISSSSVFFNTAKARFQELQQSSPSKFAVGAPSTKNPMSNLTPVAV